MPECVDVIRSSHSLKSHLFLNPQISPFAGVLYDGLCAVKKKALIYLRKPATRSIVGPGGLAFGG